jgi:hypothetical protein
MLLVRLTPASMCDSGWLGGLGGCCDSVPCLLCSSCTPQNVANLFCRTQFTQHAQHASTHQSNLRKELATSRQMLACRLMIGATGTEVPRTWRGQDLDDLHDGRDVAGADEGRDISEGEGALGAHDGEEALVEAVLHLQQQGDGRTCQPTCELAY